jgi:hypothetical protein
VLRQQLSRGCSKTCRSEAEDQSRGEGQEPYTPSQRGRQRGLFESIRSEGERMLETCQREAEEQAEKRSRGLNPEPPKFLNP